jgi:hypothetical protein
MVALRYGMFFWSVKVGARLSPHTRSNSSWTFFMTWGYCKQTIQKLLREDEVYVQSDEMDKWGSTVSEPASRTPATV